MGTFYSDRIEGYKRTSPSPSFCYKIDMLLCIHSLADSLGELVRAGGGAHAAADALQPTDHFLRVHAFYQAGNALGVAGAAADEFHVVDFFVIVHLKLNGLRTDAFCLVFHDRIPPVMIDFVKSIA